MSWQAVVDCSAAEEVFCFSLLLLSVVFLLLPGFLLSILFFFILCYFPIWIFLLVYVDDCIPSIPLIMPLSFFYPQFHFIYYYSVFLLFYFSFMVITEH